MVKTKLRGYHTRSFVKIALLRWKNGRLYNRLPVGLIMQNRSLNLDVNNLLSNLSK
jgi:hypothetical protein